MSQISANVESEAWLEENSQDLYDILRDYVKDEQRLDEVIESMLFLIPNLVQRDDLRRWGRLLEQVYERTEYALYNGLDGEHFKDQRLQMVVITKRPKVPQLPTKTTRRKRLLVHPTQLFEMFLILFMAKLYPQAHRIDNDLIISILRFARTVNDTHCLNKAHQAVAYVYNNQHKHELALHHAHIAYAYYSRENDNLEAGLSSYLLGVAYQYSGELDNAEGWFARSADHFSMTNFRRQYGLVSMATLGLKIAREEWEAALQWADVALREHQSVTDAELKVATTLHSKAIALAQLGDYEAAFETIAQARSIYKDFDDLSNLIKADYVTTFTYAKKGDLKQARKLLRTLRQRVDKHPSSGFRDKMHNTFDQLTQDMKSGGRFNP